MLNFFKPNKPAPEPTVEQAREARRVELAAAIAGFVRERAELNKRLAALRYRHMRPDGTFFGSSLEDAVAARVEEFRIIKELDRVGLLLNRALDEHCLLVSNPGESTHVAGVVRNAI